MCHMFSANGKFRCEAGRQLKAMVSCTLLAIFGLLVPGAFSRSMFSNSHTSSFPVWPDSYVVKFRFIVPYIKKYQQGPLRYDMQFWRHTSVGLQRVVRDNSETWIEDAAKDTRWYVTPANNSRDGCICEKMSEAGGPTLAQNSLNVSPPTLDASTESSEEASRTFSDLSPDAENADAWDFSGIFEELLSPALPPISAPKWKFENTTTTTLSDGSTHEVHVWLHHALHNEGFGDVNVDWRMHVTPDGMPVMLDMWGPNWFTGGHWDHYIAEFYQYQASPNLPEDLFAVPDVCQGCQPQPPDLLSFHGGHHLSHRMHAATSGILPRKIGGDPVYDAHCNAYGRAHAHRSEYERRRSHYHENSRFIVDHNSAAAAASAGSFVLGMNRFGDWSDAEFAAMKKVSKRKHAQTTSDTLEGQPQVHATTVPLHMLPETVDWRGSGADSEVKDQAMCGSCWAFAAVAPMEAAYYRSYGEFKMLSEQFLMDCSWPEGNTACNGGYQDKAFAFAVQSGGIPANDDYPYRGVNMPCKLDVPRTASIRGYVNVRGYQPQELKDAILTKGPMTVSLDADAKSFRFYKSGIYYNENCTTKPASELDHAVIISGYGRDPVTGQKYWILKNLWSTWWGEGGYIRMDMDRNDCGVSALPEYVLLDKEATDVWRQAAAEPL